MASFLGWFPHLFCQHYIPARNSGLLFCSSIYVSYNCKRTIYFAVQETIVEFVKTQQYYALIRKSLVNGTATEDTPPVELYTNGKCTLRNVVTVYLILV